MKIRELSVLSNLHQGFYKTLKNIIYKLEKLNEKSGLSIHKGTQISLVLFEKRVIENVE
jgi:hypothetical protein